jgi:hypothetical protein
MKLKSVLSLQSRSNISVVNGLRLENRGTGLAAGTETFVCSASSRPDLVVDAKPCSKRSRSFSPMVKQQGGKPNYTLPSSVQDGSKCCDVQLS